MFLKIKLMVHTVERSLNQEQKPFPRLLLFFNPVFSPAEGTVKLRPTKERKNRIVQLAVKYTAVLDANDAYHGSTNRQSFRVGFWVVGMVKLHLEEWFVLEVSRFLKFRNCEL